MDRKRLSTPAFIDAIAPSVGILSVGYRNRFRHPHEAVVARYLERDVTLRRTDQEGAPPRRAVRGIRECRSDRSVRPRQRYWSERRSRHEFPHYVLPISRADLPKFVFVVA
jgi:competence protein ComEC